MKKNWITAVGTGAIIAILVVAGTGFAQTAGQEVRDGAIRLGKQAEADFPSLAKITLDRAVQKALGAVKGEVLKAGLEDENGFLVYGVEIVAADKSITDVKVDAGSGKVLAMDRDSDDGGENEAIDDHGDHGEHEAGERGDDQGHED